MCPRAAPQANVAEDLRRYFRVRGQKNGKRQMRSTVDERMKKLRMIEREGFDLHRFLSGPLEAQDEADAILAHRLDVMDQDREGRGAGAYNQIVRLLKAIARYAGFEDELKLGYMDEPDPVNRSFTPDEMAIIKQYRHPDKQEEMRNRALIFFMLFLGWRISEYAHLEMRDIDLEAKKVRCRVPAKNGVRRWVSPSDELFSPKRPFMAWLKARPIVEGDEGAIWVRSRKRGEPQRLTKDGLRRTTLRIGKQLGLAEFNATRCRHTVGTHMYLRGGVKLRTIKAYLGHRNIESTLVYTIPPQSFVDRETKNIPSIWSGTYKERKGEENDAI